MTRFPRCMRPRTASSLLRTGWAVVRLPNEPKWVSRKQLLQSHSKQRMGPHPRPSVISPRGTRTERQSPHCVLHGWWQDSDQYTSVIKPHTRPDHTTPQPANLPWGQGLITGCLVTWCLALSQQPSSTNETGKKNPSM